MDVLYRIDSNLITAFFLTVILTVTYYRMDKTESFTQAYLITSIITVVQLLGESLMTVISGKSGQGIYYLMIIGYTVLYMLGPLISLYWYALVRKVLLPKKRYNKLFKYAMFSLQTLSTLLILMSIFNGIIFYIDDLNKYHRGDFFWVHVILTGTYLFLALLIVISNRNKLDKSEFILLGIAVIFPLVGIMTQSLVNGLLVAWSSVAFSLIFIMLILQRRLVSYDHLTYTLRRSSLIQYVNRRILDQEYFGGLYFDLDNLKQINDIYGHSIGDALIKTTIELIKQIVGNQVIARVGGDEFIIILDTAAHEDILEYIDKIRKSIAKFNEGKTFSFEISISIGGDIFDQRFKNFDEFICHIDDLMYEDKKTKHLPLFKSEIL